MAARSASTLPPQGGGIRGLEGSADWRGGGVWIGHASFLGIGCAELDWPRLLLRIGCATLGWPRLLRDRLAVAVRSRLLLRDWLRVAELATPPP